MEVVGEDGEGDEEEDAGDDVAGAEFSDGGAVGDEAEEAGDGDDGVVAGAASRGHPGGATCRIRRK